MPRMHILTESKVLDSDTAHLRKYWHQITTGPDVDERAVIIVTPRSSNLLDVNANELAGAIRSTPVGSSRDTSKFTVTRLPANMPARVDGAHGRAAPAKKERGSGKPSALASPADQKIIQIDITNACQRKCSNCTRFCGHFKDPFYMDMPTFKTAVDSLRGYIGMVGVMGGEPTLHPKFSEMVEYLNSRRPDPEPPSTVLEPYESWDELHGPILKWKPWKKGLWTGLGAGFKKHYEQIMDTFRYMCVNDHRGGCSHAALLMPRKDLGIPTDEWLKYRNACWLQHNWSACITPRGAYFCEVAGALAQVFGGPDGWDVEPGWWKRTMKDFGEQLEMCEMCSACLPVPVMLDSAETDLVTPQMLGRLEAIGSTKKVQVVTDDWETLKIKYKAIDCCEPYTEGSDMTRVHNPNGLNTGKLHGVVVCRGYDDYLALTLPRMIEELGNVTVVTSTQDTRTIRLAEGSGASLVKTATLDGTEFHKGKAIAEALAGLPKNAWVALLDADIMLPRGWGAHIRKTCLNPKALYFVERFGPSVDRVDQAAPIAKIALESDNWEAVRESIGSSLYSQSWPMGYCQVFNLGSSSLKSRKTLYPCDSASAEGDDATMCRKWYGRNRTIEIKKAWAPVLHLPHGGSRTNWKGRASRRIDDDVVWAVESDNLYWRLCYRSGVQFTGLWRMLQSLDIPKDHVIVEIGTMLGDGAIVMAAAFPENRIVTVDPAISDSIYNLARHRTADWPNIEMWRMTGEEALKRIKADKNFPPIGMAYLDGSHHGPDVVKDIEMFREVIDPNGYLCGHDYKDYYQEVIDAVDSTIGKPSKVFEDGSWIA